MERTSTAPDGATDATGDAALPAGEAEPSAASRPVLDVQEAPGALAEVCAPAPQPEAPPSIAGDAAQGALPEACPPVANEAPLPAPSVAEAAPAGPPLPPPSVPHLAGWIAVAIADTVTISMSLPRRVPVATRAATHFYDAFHLVAAGLAVAGLSALLRRLRPGWRRLRYVAAALLAAALAYPVLAEDMSGPASRLIEIIPVTAWIALLSVAASQAVLVAALLGRLLARSWVRLLGISGGLAIAIANGLNFPLSYQGVHLLAAATAATLIGASLRGAAITRHFEPKSPRARLALVAALAVAGATSLVVWPSNAVTLHLSNRPSAVLVPYLGRIRSVEHAARMAPVAQRPWFSDRSKLPAIEPSAPALIQPSSIVILIGIDSLRADHLENPKLRATLPTLFQLKESSTYFSTARSAGSSTAPSLAALFSGKYYSQLYWTQMPGIREQMPFPHTDTTPRFAEVLSEAGVSTFTVDGCGWLNNARGVVRGFDEEKILSRGVYVYSKTILGHVIRRLEEYDGNPTFIFVHLLDAHFPYDSAGKKPTPYEGYLHTLGIVDREIGRLRSAIFRQKLQDKTTLIVMADHGEAFGDHGLTWHASSLYDELLHVPLIVSFPGGPGRIVREPVSLIDLGPTILDLMGVPTPGHNMGQSLVPYLRGQHPRLDRPIVAEGRLKRAMVLPDGFKVIHDPRARYVEIFDLGRDPREEVNLYVDGDTASAERFGLLDAFFEANTLRRPGYRVPYRKW